mmetsp:Transcript_19827/g.35744  ORF Transcript_19827/g.35744 Transcript_19827/m.35744 type:complete len:533 (+) Transcript_19827:64-1662(+)
MTGQNHPSAAEIVEDAAYLKNEQQHYQQQQQQQQQSTTRTTHGDAPHSTPNILSSWKTEARMFLELAGVTTLLNLGFVLSPFLTASHIGRTLGSLYLSSFTLANLTANLCTFSLMAGLWSASDTLSPQAFGLKNYPELGYIAVRGCVTSVVVLLPINVVLTMYLEPILTSLGQDPQVSLHAQAWYRIYVLSIPFNILYNAVWKFLSAQHVMKALITTSMLSCFLVLPLALSIFTKAFGFLGSALAYVVFQAAQATFLVGYLIWKRPHHPETWKGLSSTHLKRALRLGPLVDFLHLGAGGCLAQIEWVFWEALGLVAGLISVESLSTHQIANQTIMALCMPPFSFGTAVAVRMGVSLPVSIQRTQYLVYATLLFSVITFGIVSVLVYVWRDVIFGIFTNDAEVQELADKVWADVCLFSLNVAVFGVLVGVATGLGKQWALGFTNSFCMFVIGLPLIYYTSITLDGGLEALWRWVNVPYLFMNIALAILFIATDWQKIQKEILLKDDKDGTFGSPSVSGRNDLESTNNEMTRLL